MSFEPKVVSLLLTCLDGDECQVAFEPEGAVHTLKAGDAFRVEVKGVGSGEVEIGFVPNGITVVAWDEATTVVRNRAGSHVPT
jgi:hypothetical protein